MNRKRGRPSGAELAAPAPLSVYPRQPLPPELSGDEAEVFLSVINTEEAAWFTRSNLPLLVQYCRHVVQARRLAELLGDTVGRDTTSWATYAALLQQQRAETAAIASLSVKMRIAPSSARKDRGAPKRVGPAPWEM